MSGKKWNAATKTLSATSQVIGNDPYELRIAGLQEAGRTWTLLSAKALPDETRGVTVEPKSMTADEEGWLRVVVKSKESCPVKWSLKCALDEQAGG